VLAHRSNHFSYPSGHAVTAGAVAAGLWLINRRLGLIATRAAPVTAFARVHYPDDVAAGPILGATIALAGYAVQGPRPHPATSNPMRPLVTTPSARDGHPRHRQRRVGLGGRGPSRGQTSPPPSSSITDYLRTSHIQRRAVAP
jgi:membrane-associated phospholipid phosphatase